MTKDEIKNIKEIRYKLRRKIMKNIDRNIKDDTVKKLVLEYNKLTEQLENAGCNVSIKSDYLQMNYWDNINDTHKYTISLAWTESPDKDVSNIIDKIKEYFDDMDIRPTDSNIYKSIGGTENVIKYEFNGNDKSFKILKYSAQFLLDTISNTDYEKFNIAVFGKKK